MGFQKNINDFVGFFCKKHERISEFGLHAKIAVFLLVFLRRCARPDLRSYLPGVEVMKLKETTGCSLEVTNPAFLSVGFEAHFTRAAFQKSC